MDLEAAALDCPEIDIQKGKYATKVAKQFAGLQAICELTKPRRTIAWLAIVKLMVQTLADT